MPAKQKILGYSELENSFLFKRLPDEHKQVLKSCVDYLRDLWPEVRLIHHHTEHGYDHSIRILYRLEKLPRFKKKSEKLLSDIEIFVLLLSIFLHDIGMQCDFRKYPSVKQTAEDEFNIKFVSVFGGDFTQENMIELRKYHHLVTSAWLLDAFKNKTPVELYSILCNLKPEILSIVRVVCQYHSKENIKECPVDSFGKKQRFLASLMRLGDELDIDEKRINEKTTEFFDIPDDNSLFWYLHKQTRIEYFDDKIRFYIILSNYDYDHYKDKFNEYFHNLYKKNEDVLQTMGASGLYYNFDNRGDCVTKLDEQNDIPENIIKTIFPDNDKQIAIPLSHEEDKFTSPGLNDSEWAEIFSKTELHMFLTCDPFPDPITNRNLSGRITYDLFFNEFHVMELLTYKRLCLIAKVLDNINQNTIFFTGYRGSGKTTLAKYVYEIFEDHRKIKTIDFDNFKKQIDSGSKVDDKNVREQLDDVVKDFEGYFDKSIDPNLRIEEKVEWVNNHIRKLESALKGRCFYFNFETDIDLSKPKQIENKLIFILGYVLENKVMNSSKTSHYVLNLLGDIKNKINHKQNRFPSANKFLDFYEKQAQQPYSFCKDGFFDYLENTTTKDLMVAILLLDMIKLHYEQKNEQKIVYIFDNLDAIDDPMVTSKFLNEEYIEFLTEMSETFDFISSEVEAFKGKNINFHERYCCIFMMRDTTANILGEHYDGGRFSGFSENEDLSIDIDKAKVLKVKSNYIIKKIRNVKQKTKDHILLINSIIEDPNMSADLSGLFNNDYIRLVRCLCEICKHNHELLKEYISMQTQAHKTKFELLHPGYITYGARGIVYRLIFEHFRHNSFTDKQDGYFQQIGIKFGNRVPEEFSLSRLILFYLSYHMPKHFKRLPNNADDMVPLSRLVYDFKMALGETEERTIELLSEVIFGMYSLRKSESWSHLVTFDSVHLEPSITKDTIKDIFKKSVDKDSGFEGKIAITCAGRSYVRIVCSHFEFLAMRFVDIPQKVNNIKPLFSSKNMHYDNHNNCYGYEILLNNFYGNFETGLSTLEEIETNMFNRLGKQGKGIWESPFIYHDPQNKNISMFHLERALHRMITYINCYRTWIIEQKQKDGDLLSHNEKISLILEKYVKLLDDPKFSQRSKKLYAEYFKAFHKIRSAKYEYYEPIYISLA
jgi:energy-coupling factor transporter ATP-binding protein EcfA2